MATKSVSLVKVFQNPERHREVADIILRHLSNKRDIRLEALDGLDLSECKSILDLGCGFGFFIDFLKGQVHQMASITGVDQFPEYELIFCQSSINAGLKPFFISSGVESIRKLDPNSFDLVLCSYAMYFFPDIIQHITRILKTNGIFLTITHELPHMQEFTSYVKKILRENGIHIRAELPYERLIGRFSNYNAPALLKHHFREISSKRYEAFLTFCKENLHELIYYFNFKKSFFIPVESDPQGILHDRVISIIERDLKSNNKLSITKNDIIFICKGPQ
jgi:SAM-dependent methyltransferase